MLTLSAVRTVIVSPSEMPTTRAGNSEPLAGRAMVMTRKRGGDVYRWCRTILPARRG